MFSVFQQSSAKIKVLTFLELAGEDEPVGLGSRYLSRAMCMQCSGQVKCHWKEAGGHMRSQELLTNFQRAFVHLLKRTYFPHACQTTLSFYHKTCLRYQGQELAIHSSFQWKNLCEGKCAFTLEPEEGQWQTVPSKACSPQIHKTGQSQVVQISLRGFH